MWDPLDPITETGPDNASSRIDLPALLRPPPKPLPKHFDAFRGIALGVMLGAEMWAVIAIIAVSCAML